MLQRNKPPAARRFVTAKVWAVRIGLMAAVGAGVGVVGGVLTQSWIGVGVAFLLGAAASARRAMRVTSDDIDF